MTHLPPRALGKTGLAVSPIGLGTVEIGLPYGIGVKDLPGDTEADRLLKAAVDMGITYIDTARGYGLAEERIGRSGIGKNPQVIIGTKCAQFLEQGADLRGQELETRIREEIETSLRLLKVDVLQLVQLHGGSREQIERGELIHILRKLREQGKIQHVGIATRSNEAALAAIASGFFATIQTAYSILDQRVTPVLPYARQKNIGIINRSVLLKGALTPAAAQLPDTLAPLKKNSLRAQAIARELAIDLPALAVRFAASNPAVSTILIGTAAPRHLESALKAMAAGPLPADALAQLADLAVADPDQVDPSRWPKT